MRHYLLLAALLGGCVADFGDTDSSVKGQDTSAAVSNCKIEGSQIGEEGVTLTHGKRTVTFRKWVDKAGSSDEYVGFTLELNNANSLSYRVKAGTQVYSSKTTTWLHPAGVSGGSSAPAISNVQFCDCDCDCSDGGGSNDGGGGTGSGDGPIIL